MANLIDVAEELEFIPEDQLAAMIDDPNSRYPSFMVLSEVQRRTKMRKMYENEMSKMNQPQTTVAEEAVMGLMQGQGAMPMQAGMSSPVNSQGSGLQGMAPPTLTAQTGLFTSQEQLIARLKRLAEQGDINAQRDLQQLTQRLGGLGDSVYTETKVDLSRTMPKDFTVQNLPQKQRDVLSQTFQPIGDYLTQGDFSSAYGLGQTVGASAVAPLRGITERVVRDLDYLGQPVLDFTKGVFGLSQAKSQQLTEDPTTPTNFRDAVNRAKTDLAGGKARIGDDQPTAPDAKPQQVVSTNQPDELPLTVQDVLAQIRGDEQQPVFEGLSQQNQQLLQQLRNKASDNTDVLGLTKETLERLPIPKLDLPEVTEEDRQKELSAYTLSSLAKIISGARNVSDIGKGLGEAGIGLQALKKQQKKEQRQALIDSQKEDIRRFGIASSLASSQLAQDQARLQGQIGLANLESALTNHEFNRAKTEELAKRANDKFALDVFNLVEGSKFNKDKLEILKQQAVNQGNQNNLSKANALLKLIENMQAEIGDFTLLRTRFPETDEGQKQYQDYVTKKAKEVARLEREINNLLGVQDIANEALATAQTFIDTI